MLETMLCGMNLDIKIQSFGDVITNSSSEIFCTIESANIQEIYHILQPLFEDAYYDLDPTIHYNQEKEVISVYLPYDFSRVGNFYRAGLEAILDRNIGNENYSISYD